jgi:hypothetical protein
MQQRRKQGMTEMLEAFYLMLAIYGLALVVTFAE